MPEGRKPGGPWAKVGALNGILNIVMDQNSMASGNHGTVSAMKQVIEIQESFVYCML